MRLSNPEVIFDASALVSLLKPESNDKHIEILDRFYGKFAMSAINVAEVVDVLMRQGLDSAFVIDTVKLSINVGFVLQPDLNVAILAGEIRSKFAKPPYELSMADCFCLAHAKILDLPAITADKAWSKIAKSYDIQVIQYR